MSIDSPTRGRPAPSRYDHRGPAYEPQSRHAGTIYVLMLVVAVAFGGFLWQLYSEPAGSRPTSPPTPYTPAPPLQPPTTIDRVEETVSADDAGEAAAALLEDGAPVPGDAPLVVADGSFVVQLAALQSEAAVDAAWSRIAARAPQMFAHTALDVERADLGQRGVYYRVRAGYFADRDNAVRFCERIRQMGQDCIVAAR